MESPFLTKKIKQKFPQLPGYVIPENQLRATGDTEIEINSNGTYILGQNDQDPDDLEMDEELTSNPNQSLILSKTGTRDTTPTFVLGKFNVNVPQSVEFEQSNITNNGYYLMNKNSNTNKYEPVQSTSSDYNLNINIPQTTNPKINISYIRCYSNNYALNTFTYSSSYPTINLSPGYGVLVIKIESNDYNIRYRYNNTNSNISIELNSGIYYKIFITGEYDKSVLFKENNLNNNYVISLSMLKSSVTMGDFIILLLNKNNFNLIFD